MNEPSRWSMAPHVLLRRMIRTEAVRLGVLVVIAAGTFAITRQIAHAQHEREQRDAAAWYARGEQHVAQGELPAAIAAFRRAMVGRPPEKKYVLGLAETLVRAGNLDSAARVLERTRVLTPDDPAINRALARVAAAHHDVTGAIRYYHNALYGPWTTPEGPRQIRFELIRFLLAHDDNRRAISELIAATTDLPDEPEAHFTLGRLFAEADDPARALDQFTRTLRLAPRHRGALEGAVRAAFTLGDYERVRRYALPGEVAADVKRHAQVADLVVTQDPLANRIGAATRQRRLSALAGRARTRARECTGAGRAAPPDETIAERVRQLDAMRLERAAVGRDAEVIESAMLLLAQLTARLDQTCGNGTPLDEALTRIARRHGVAEP